MNINDVYAELPVLETDRVKLRKLTQADETDMFNYASDEAVSKFTVWNHHQTIDDTRSFINKVLESYEKQIVAPWGIEHKESGTMIGTAGYIYWDTKNSKAELGYALSKAYWNQGYMSEVVKKLIAFGFDRLQLVRIEARCHPNNIGSYRVMEKAGMQFEGILRKCILAKGEYEDVRMYSIIKDDI